MQEDIVFIILDYKIIKDNLIFLYNLFIYKIINLDYKMTESLSRSSLTKVLFSFDFSFTRQNKPSKKSYPLIIDL